MSETDVFYSIANEVQSEIIIKKSRFICTLAPTLSKKSSDELIVRIKKQNFNAAHNCSAVIIGEKSEYQHCSDDGEPQGTAGLPMLEGLRSNNLTYITAVVTRYFGGTLLGAGGLVRAYSASVAEAVKNAVITENIPAQVYAFTIDYADYSKLMNISQTYGSAPEAEFTDCVKAKIIIKQSDASAFEKQITQAFLGKAVFEKTGTDRIIKNKI